VSWQGTNWNWNNRKEASKKLGDALNSQFSSQTCDTKGTK
jgi:hypothetical protein